MQLPDDDRPTVLGSGLIALDLIVTPGGAVTHSVGGTCGNVLTILAAHHVDVKPAARVGDDVSGRLIKAHMEAWGSDVSLFEKTSDIKTPRIVELVPITGSTNHRFSFTCPECNMRLPRNSPLRTDEAKRMEIDWSSIDLFFFDRITPAGTHLARLAREAGVTVMLEPPKSQANSRLSEAVATADIVKYSSQNFRHGLPIEPSSQIQLLIETQDRRGLRFRHREGTALGNWRSFPAFDAVQPRDAAGAGDWCSAGLIADLIGRGKGGSWNQSELETALLYGQALAAISVCFIGPLGALFALSREELQLAAQEVVRTGAVPEWARLQGEENMAFGAPWPIDLMPPPGACGTCLLDPQSQD